MAGYTEATQLLNAPNLRAMLIALRNRVRRFEPPDTPNPALTAIVRDPFDSVTDVTTRLTELEARLRDQDDRRAIFLTIYRQMTAKVRDGINHGQFENSDWMTRYLVGFANYYRRAFLAFEEGRLTAVPDPWRITFGTALRGDSLVIQDSVLGINAHINYDLALTLNEVGIDPNRAQKYQDHVAINDTLARLIDIQQAILAEMYAAGIGDIDTALGRLDESFFLRTMTEGREQAWRVAVVLADVRIVPIESYARWVLRTTATGGAYFILGPRLDHDLYQRIQRFEAEGFDLELFLDRVHERSTEGS